MSREGPAAVCSRCGSYTGPLHRLLAVCEITVCDFKALGWLVKESGAEVLFSSLLPSRGDGVGWNRRIRSINAWLRDWCYRQDFGFFVYG